MGAQHCPLGLHALWGLRAVGVVGGGPRGGWPATVLKGVWCQALSLPRPPVLWAGQPGFRVPCVPGAVGAGVGTQHQPHGTRPCRPALRAVGMAEGRPQGGLPFAVVRGVWGQALPLPRLPALWPGCQGPLPTCSGRGCAGVDALHWPCGPRALWGAARHGGCGARLGSGAPSLLLPAPWAGCRGSLATCCGRGCWCVWCVWCLCGACRGAWCRFSLVPLVLPSPVLRCGVVPAVCRLPAVPPSLRASLARLMATPCFFRGFVALYRLVCSPFSLACTFSLPSPWCVSLSFSSPAFSLVAPCETKGRVGECGPSAAWCGPCASLAPLSLRRRGV